jgi:aryl carrier-like protein
MSLPQSDFRATENVLPSNGADLTRLDGYHVIPLAPGSKVPMAGTEYQSPDARRYTVADLEPGQNVGLLLGMVYGGWGFIELDVDCPDRWQVEGLRRALTDNGLSVETFIKTGGDHDGYSLLIAARADCIPDGFRWGVRYFGHLSVEVRHDKYRVIPPSVVDGPYQYLDDGLRDRESVELELGISGPEADAYAPAAMREGRDLFAFLSALPTESRRAAAVPSGESDKTCRLTPTRFRGACPDSNLSTGDDVSRQRRRQVSEPQASVLHESTKVQTLTLESYLADVGLQSLDVDSLADVWRREGVFSLVLDYGHRRRYGQPAWGRNGYLRDIFETEGNPSTRLYSRNAGEPRYFRGFRATVGPVPGAAKAMSIQETYAAIVTGKVGKFDGSAAGCGLHRKWSRRLVLDWNIWTAEARAMRDRQWWQSETELGRIAAVVRGHLVECARLEAAPLLTAKALATRAGIDRHKADYALSILIRVGLLSRGELLGRKTRAIALESATADSVEARLELLEVDPDNPATWYRISKADKTRAIVFLPDQVPEIPETGDQVEAIQTAPASRQSRPSIRVGVSRHRPEPPPQRVRAGPAPPTPPIEARSPDHLRLLMRAGVSVRVPVYGLRGRAVG